MDSPATIVLPIVGVLVLFVVLKAIFGSFFTVDTAHAGIVQRLGKFARIAPPGLNWKVPFLDSVVGNLSLQVQQLDSRRQRSQRQRRRVTRASVADVTGLMGFAKISVVFFLVALGAAPSKASPKKAAGFKPGYYSRDAVVACSLRPSSPALTLRSPDGAKAMVIRPVQISGLDGSSLTVEAFGRKFEAGFTWSPDCEVAWSPDSRAFFATYTEGGAVGNFVTKVFYVTPRGLREVDPTKPLVAAFMSRPHYCYWDEGPNLGSIIWTRGSSRLLIAAEVAPHTVCEEMGTFRAYEVAVPSGKIVRTYDQLIAKKLFWPHLGDELRGADDECIKDPESCNKDAVKRGLKRFTH